MFSSLTNRIFLASAVLAILCISTAIYVVNVSVTRSAENALADALRQTGAVVDQQRATVSGLFAFLARFIDQHSNLKAAVATDDPPTLLPIVAEYQRGTDADLLLVTDRSGRVLANLARDSAADPTFASLPTVHDALAGRESSMFWTRPGGVAQVVSVPIKVGPEPPEIVGSFSLAFLLNDALAAKLKRLTRSDIAFTAGGKVVASTLPQPLRQALTPLIGKIGTSSAWVGGEEYVALQSPLAPPERASLFGGAAMPRLRGPGGYDQPVPTTIVLRSRTEQLRFLRQIQQALVTTGIVAVFLAIVLGYWISRTITRPLAAITDTMREMAATGDLTRKIAWRPRRWEDEDARLLARTFNTLTESVARFQRDAAERERLSALGRLSSVIAHEVRNPLMIIKASLQPLTRGTPQPDQIREAADDIDEEVTRLNRLVNDVLDFARPLRFELAATDINRLCEESAQAASADRSGPPIHVDLDPALPVVQTDGERLRVALVNILVNARHAVVARKSAETQARGIGGMAAGAQAVGSVSSVEAAAALRQPATAVDAPHQPEVEIRTAAIGDHRFAIIARDRGVGIAPENLARVFEPYFTTKRTGTGLGLAITGNIIEGLGGTIAIASEPGSGTEIRIELPVNGPAPSDTQR